MRDLVPIAISLVALIVIVVLCCKVHYRLTVAIGRGLSWLIDRSARLIRRVTS